MFFGVFSVVLSLALYDRLKSAMRNSKRDWFIGRLADSRGWSRMTERPVVHCLPKTQLRLGWPGGNWNVASGLGNANGADSGRLMTLIVSLPLCGWQASQGIEYQRLVGWHGGHHLPYPGLPDLMIGVFGLGQIIGSCGWGSRCWAANRAN